MPIFQIRVRRLPRVISFSISLSMYAAFLPLLAACSGLTDTTVPSNLVTKENGETQEGAVALYQGSLTQFSQAYGASNKSGGVNGSVDPTYYSYTIANGLFSDELTAGGSEYDSRITTDLTENGGNGPYTILHQARLTMARALAALGQYPATPPSYRGELHALQGYIRVMFAELYCSGVPFSYLDNTGAVVYGMPESSTQMYQNAIAQFDSATAIATDSIRIRQLAAIGKARALLDLGEYDSAAAAVAGIPTNFVSNVNYSSAHGVENFWRATAEAVAASPYASAVHYIADVKGTNGLDFVTAADPRLPFQAAGFFLNYARYPIIDTTFLDMPAAFARAADLPIPLATGIEGQLIVAEAALKHGDPSWLTTLNALRTTGSYSGIDTSVVSIVTDPNNPAVKDTTFRYDTLWTPGTGGVARLGPLHDPGSTSADVLLLFRERAFWLFATGHRTGDLRRLVRQYAQPENTVFPVGTNSVQYPPTTFGTQMNVEPPRSERANPNYHGCISRDA